MSALSDYLENRRLAREAEEEKRDAKDSSPEDILLALNANTGHTADLVGDQTAASHTQNRAVLDSLEIVTEAIDNIQPDNEQVTFSIDSASAVEQQSARITNKTLLSINETLKALASSTALVEKYLRPALNSKDDTYGNRHAAKLAIAGAAAGSTLRGPTPDSGLGSLIGDSIFDLFGSKKPKPGKVPKPGEVPKPGRAAGRGRFGKFGRMGKGVLGAIRSRLPFLSTAAAGVGGASQVLPNSISVLPSTTSEVPAVEPTAAAKPKLLERVGTKAGKLTGDAINSAKSFGSKVASSSSDYLARARAAAPEAFSTAQKTGSTIATKSAEYISRAKTALAPAAETASSVGSKAWKVLSETGSKAASYVQETGTNLLGKVKPSASAATGATEGLAMGAAEASPGMLRSAALTGGKVLGRLATPLAIGMSGYDAYQTEQDDTLTRDEKNVKHAGTVGGLGGAIGGAAIGATVGSVVPVVGTAIGGLVGGGLGYMAGTEVGERAMSGLQSARDMIPDSVKNGLGTAVALAVSPFSQDARDALKTEFLPELDKVRRSFEDSTQSLSDSTEALSKTFSTTFTALTTKLTDSWDETKSSMGNALSSAGSWFGSKVTSAGEGIKSATEGTAFEGAGKAVGGSVSKAGSSIAIKSGEVGYNLQKGSKDSLELAQGFQGGSSLKGLTEAQTKAYAGDVMKTESGGQLDIENPYGYVGQYQFGAAALADTGLVDKDKLAAAKVAAKSNGQKWYDKKTGGAHKAFMNDKSNWKIEGGQDAFLADKKLQDDTFVKYTNKNIEAGYKSGALTSTSTAADIAGYSKASHLVGAGAANKLYKYGVDKADANGTSAALYAKQGAAAMGDLASKVESTSSKTPVIKTAMAEAKPVPTVTSAPATPMAEAKPVPTVTSAPATPRAEAKPVPTVTSAPATPMAEAKVVPTVTTAKPETKATTVKTQVQEPIKTAQADLDDASQQQQQQDSKPARKLKLTPVASEPVADIPSRPQYAMSAMGSTGLASAQPELPQMSVESMKALAQTPDVSSILAQPNVAKLMEDPSVASLIARQDVSGLMSHPLVRQVSSTLPSQASAQSSPTQTVASDFLKSVSPQPNVSNMFGSLPIGNSLGSAASLALGNIGPSETYGPEDSYAPVRQVPELGVGQYNVAASSVSSRDYDPQVPAMYSQAPSQVYARQQPLPKLATNMPEESKPVSVSNAADIAQPGGPTSLAAPQSLTASFDTAVPRLDNIPLQVSDMGLVLLNIGHI